MQPKMDILVSALLIVKHLLNMRPTDPQFLLAVLMMASIGVSLWEKKLQVFISLRFSQQEAFSIFKRYPQSWGFSEEKLRTKLGFYFNTVKLNTDNIISYPNLLSFSIETRIRPRHNVLKLLLSKKLLPEDAKIAYLFAMSEDKFLSKYGTCHLQQVPSLLEMYNNDKAVKKIAQSMATSEDEFLSKYVIEHLQQVPSLLEMYNNDRAVKNIGAERVQKSLELELSREILP